MSKWTISNIATWTQGTILSQFQSEFSFLGTDTRVDLKDKVFIALKGDHYDAHQFLDKAVQAGAGLLIVDHLRPEFADLKNKVSILQVADTLQALQDFAHHYRKNLKTQIIGITGSNGKTTTKEFTATLLGAFKKTHFNKGSFNNHWGVPLTLLEIPEDAAFAVIEMGMNHAGEIARLVEIADPDVVVCTMVGRAHIENFGTQKKIAEAKAEIYMHSRESAIRIFNQDQDLTFDMMYPVAKKYPASRMLSFSEKNKEADVFLKVDKISPQGLEVSGQIGTHWGAVSIPVFGSHNLTNILAAANIAYVLGVSPDLIWKSLSLLNSSWGRNQFITAQNNIHILFDGYNANPDSMQALLSNIKLIERQGDLIGVFGQMKELGDQSAHFHFELGFAVGMTGFDHVFFIGENAEDFKAGLLKSDYKKFDVDQNLTEHLGQNFLKILKPNSFVVVKGSRGAKTERFVELCEPLNWSAKY